MIESSSEHTLDTLASQFSSRHDFVNAELSFRYIKSTSVPIHGININNDRLPIALPQNYVFDLKSSNLDSFGFV